jgi:peptidoglycan/LPS O-acetylase OafA/YrhL
MTGNYLARRLIRLLPLAIAAIAMMILGPDRLEHLQTWQRLGLIGGIVVAFVSSIVIGKRSNNAAADSGQNAGLVRFARALWSVMVITNVCAAVMGIVAVVVLYNVVPVRYLILAPIVNLILAGLFYQAVRRASRDPRRLA